MCFSVFQTFKSYVDHDEDENDVSINKFYHVVKCMTYICDVDLLALDGF
jgi:hypothetical protein